MGDLSSWSRRSCSRLSLAATYVAACIQQAVAPWDTFAVLTFSRECRKIVDWRCKGEAFDPLQLMSSCEASIGALPRGGTNMFSAFSTAIQELAHRPRSASGAVDSANQRRQLVLLTDGEATDDEVYEQAHALACRPPNSMDFKAFLVGPCPAICYLGCGWAKCTDYMWKEVMLKASWVWFCCRSR